MNKVLSGTSTHYNSREAVKYTLSSDGLYRKTSDKCLKTDKNSNKENRNILHNHNIHTILNIIFKNKNYNYNYKKKNNNIKTRNISSHATAEA